MPAASASPAPVTATTPLPAPFGRRSARRRSQPSPPVLDPPSRSRYRQLARAPEPRPSPAPSPVAEPKRAPRQAPRRAPRRPFARPVPSPSWRCSTKCFATFRCCSFPEPEPLPWHTPPALERRAGRDPGAARSPSRLRRRRRSAPLRSGTRPGPCAAPRSARLRQPRTGGFTGGAPRHRRRARRSVPRQCPRHTSPWNTPARSTQPDSRPPTSALLPRPTARRSRRVGSAPAHAPRRRGGAGRSAPISSSANPSASAGRPVPARHAAQTGEEPASVAPASEGALAGGRPRARGERTRRRGPSDHRARPRAR